MIDQINRANPVALFIISFIGSFFLGLFIHCVIAGTMIFFFKCIIAFLFGMFITHMINLILWLFTK